MKQHEKTAAKVALVAAGLWRAFHRTRDKLKVQGMAPQDAYQVAFESFFPSGAGTAPALPDGCVEETTESGAVGENDRVVTSRVTGTTGAGEDAQDTLPRIPSKLFKGKTASRAEVVDWVAENVAVEGVDADTCPSAEAWAMLRWVRRSLMNETDFWKTIYRALLPARSELDAVARFADDGRNVLRVISMMEKTNKADGPP